MELTVLMPCLNECESVGFCVAEAMEFLRSNAIDGEVLVADNGSSDGSREIAAGLGARVVTATERGYGSALRCGIDAALGKYVIMADSDGSYDFSALMPFLTMLRDGAELVIGDRYRGCIQQGAFPWTHRYLGVPVLSWLGRLAGRCGVRDFHCGLRGVRRESFLALGCACSGMEFASEMILLARRKNQRIEQLPADLRRDRRENTSPHLCAVSDGLRHIRIIFKYTINEKGCR